MDICIVSITGFVCISLVSIVGILLNRKEGVTFNLKNNYKDFQNEIFFTTSNTDNQRK
ncbi:hypothetical protein [Clostridium aciditolerans]|uniref:Uncharacterized protein n=1 Tax=Clostridium aciditolerans TaxID=339861 RepID=A0A934M7F2_9CLOT|nr:hypothetical protein [Clostridium aciditolerans]MBI6875623.1 hypothetical protein [Clostridium aciditolerans]